MDRNKFLRSLGLTGAALFATYCLGSCKKDEAVAPAGTTLPDTGLVLDLNSATYSSLKNNNAFVVLVNEKIVVARTSTGVYVAVTRICSHEQKVEVTFLAGQDKFECTAHQAQFSTTGAGLNSKGSGGLRVYRTQINTAGDTLTLFNN